MEFRTGQRLRHFRLLSRLGDGGGGEVWLAEDEGLGRRVALKIPNPEVVGDPRSLKRFEREARALARLSHPNVVRIVSVHDEDPREDGVPFLVMEHVEGKTLADALAGDDARLSTARVIEIGAALASALRAVHAGGIVHRDLKPENVMLATDGGVKVIDFGIAQLAGPADHEASDGRAVRLTRHGTAMGTCPYMSPEQACGRDADARSDLFALGAVLFEMATGERAFDGRSEAETFAALLKHEPPPVTEPRPDLPPDLAAIVARCLAKDPERRYQTARELAEDLDELGRRLATGDGGKRRHAYPVTEAVPLPTGASADPLARPRTRVATAAQAIRRRPMLASVSALALVVALALSGAALWPEPTPDPAVAAGGAVAVIPALDGVTDGEVHALEEGLSAGVSTRLSDLPSLRVLGRGESTTVVEKEAEKPGPSDPVEIASRLGAARVVETSLRRGSGGLRATVRILDGTTGAEIWSDVMSARGSELLSLQHMVSEAVATRLLGALTPEERAAIERDPTSSYQAYTDYLNGESCLRRLDEPQYYETAASLFQAALDADPSFALAHAGLSEARWAAYYYHPDAGLLEDAREHAERAIELDPDLPQALAALARVDMSSGHLEEAVKRLETALPRHDARGRVFRALAASYERLGDFEKAEKSFRLAVDADRDDWLAWNALASYLLRRGERAEAREAYTRADELAAPDDDYRPRSNRAAIDVIETRYDEAIAAYKTIPGVERSWSAASNLGTAYYYLDAFEEAERWYRIAVRLAPDIPETRRNLGDLFEATDRHDLAIHEYEAGRDVARVQAQHDPSDDRLRAHHALLVAKAGDCEGAMREARSLFEGPKRATIKATHDGAATFALCGATDEALLVTRRLIAAGYPIQSILDEPEFESIRAAIEAGPTGVEEPAPSEPPTERRPAAPR